MIFRKPNILLDSCTVKNINFNFSIWHRLENTNSWMYITNQDNVIIKCRDQTEIETINVNGTGILDLSNQLFFNSSTKRVNLLTNPSNQKRQKFR